MSRRMMISPIAILGLGNGFAHSVWKDLWIGDSLDRGGIEEQHLEHLVALLDSVKLADIPTRWVTNIPIKVNIFAWKLALDRLPTRANIYVKGMSFTESQSLNSVSIVVSSASVIVSTDHNLWDIIVNGDLEDEATPSGEQSSPPVPKTEKQLAARRNQERIKSILLLTIPDEYLLKFHNVPDAKSLWAAIKSRFRGNEKSKKMQKNVLKYQFKIFVTASNETLDKAYDRFQQLISQLEIHGAYVSKEDINQKFLRSLPPSWSQIALIMRNKPDIDEIDIDDLC
ncbi:hypothetical protein Tco_0542811 [Tanacetum coccineum]